MGWVKKQEDSVETISSTNFFRPRGLRHAFLGGPNLTSGIFVRGGYVSPWVRKVFDSFNFYSIDE
jgi:hypothetical protein